jgi:hypothetical protein
MNNIYQLMNWVENNRRIAALIVLYAQVVILLMLYMYVSLKSPAGRGKLDGGKILSNCPVPSFLAGRGFLHNY